MNTTSPILLPLVCLTAWTIVIWGWMYMTRIPALVKAKMKLDPFAPRGEQMNQLPPSVRWKADNYNNLMEQPTVFYAVALVLAVIGQGEGINARLAWAYVALRVVHSLVQVMVNKIEVRFLLFVLSGVVLAGLVLNALRAVL